MNNELYITIQEVAKTNRPLAETVTKMYNTIFEGIASSAAETAKQKLINASGENEYLVSSDKMYDNPEEHGITKESTYEDKINADADTIASQEKGHEIFDMMTEQDVETPQTNPEPGQPQPDQSLSIDPDMPTDTAGFDQASHEIDDTFSGLDLDAMLGDDTESTDTESEN